MVFLTKLMIASLISQIWHNVNLTIIQKDIFKCLLQPLHGVNWLAPNKSIHPIVKLTISQCDSQNVLTRGIKPKKLNSTCHHLTMPHVIMKLHLSMVNLTKCRIFKIGGQNDHGVGAYHATCHHLSGLLVSHVIIMAFHVSWCN